MLIHIELLFCHFQGCFVLFVRGVLVATPSKVALVDPLLSPETDVLAFHTNGHIQWFHVRVSPCMVENQILTDACMQMI
jgi:hypothetical protein